MTATGLPSSQGCRASCIPHGDVGVEAEDSDDRAEAEDGGGATPGGVPASLAQPNRHRPWLTVSMPSVECYEQFHEMQEARQEQGNGLQALHHEQGSRSEESEGDFNLIAIRCLGSDPGMTAGCKRVFSSAEEHHVRSFVYRFPAAAQFLCKSRWTAAHQ